MPRDTKGAVSVSIFKQNSVVYIIYDNVLIMVTSRTSAGQEFELQGDTFFLSVSFQRV